MKRPPLKRMMTALALAGACGGAAGAATLDFGVTYRSGAALWDGGLLRFGVSEVPLGRATLSAAVSNRAVEAGVGGGLSLPPAGALTLRADAALTYRGGVRLAPRASGTLGPVALNVGGAFFTAAATEVDPLAAWTLTPTDLRARGWAADFTARYRVGRALVAVLGGEFGPQNQGFAGAEWRRDLTRVLPPAEGDDPATEPLTETTGSVTLRLGARAGQGVLGVTGGVSYSAESGLSLALDALAGPGGWGAVGSLSAPDPLGEGSDARLYVAYEPWRRASAPLRAGAEVSLPAGPGTLSAAVRGGLTASGTSGFGVRVGYSLPLGAWPERP
ncbi:hypothetical protein [Deinococcus budaensis]|uniref:Uncharacterized protein n=1 Tax=Deinococcus budaensis TaxID=1665626 RepID=A0A7W8GD70_9DEIO|nr:hypothetical protein [Deinococcus budaensis]MBB5233440.1 hypothetical protein [Deinococcus budaensis]